MKTVLFIYLFMLYPCFAHWEKVEQKIVIENKEANIYKIPISEKSIDVLTKALDELDCNLTGYFHMWGVLRKKNDFFLIDQNKRILIFETDIRNAEVVSTVISELNLQCRIGKLPSEKVLKLFTFDDKKFSVKLMTR